jgi:hypothetical protein
VIDFLARHLGAEARPPVALVGRAPRSGNGRKRAGAGPADLSG